MDIPEQERDEPYGKADVANPHSRDARLDSFMRAVGAGAARRRASLPELLRRERPVLDAFPYAIAVVAGSGRVLAVNRAWRESALSRGGSRALASGDRQNYFDVCRAAAATDPSARAVLDALQALIAGTAESAAIEYECPSPAANRWFLMYASRLPGHRGALLVSHVDVTSQRARFGTGQRPAALHDTLQPIAAELDRVRGRLADTTERIEHQERLFARAQAMTHSGCWECDLRSGEMTWSASLYRMYGVDPETFRPTLERVIASAAPSSRAALAAAMDRASTQHEPFDLEYDVLDASGARRRLWTTCEFDDTLARGPRLLGVCRDITELREMECLLADAALREQERIGKDLHDSLGQQLVALQLRLSSLRRRWPAAAGDARAEFNALDQELAQAIEETRRLAYGLAALPAGGGDMVLALRALARPAAPPAAAVRYSGVESLTTAGTTADLVQVFRIAQEALSNALRHSGASRVDVSIRAVGARWILDVTDDGCGLPPAAGRRQGLGLRTMQWRAELAGATVSVEAVGPRGTRVRIAFARCRGRRAASGDASRRATTRG